MSVLEYNMSALPDQLEVVGRVTSYNHSYHMCYYILTLPTGHWITSPRECRSKEGAIKAGKKFAEKMGWKIKKWE